MLDEALFTLVRMKAWRDLGIRRIEDLRDYIRAYGYKPFKEEMGKLRDFVKEAGITVLEDKAQLQEVIEAIKRLNLLPADTIIALTCRHYGIDTILTFDEDFRRVPWLRVLP
ncbi:hypothetical protein PABY_14040 [Pyrodictium abyssi]|uniref:PIN domain-containing protein n=1 Tax=Pyrodictium abyssi TaxID=54256 RepID=A0ABM8IW98_9CREN|nr:hypothetical protein PABY_14040 [Pyrodictium abyssi]